MAVLIIFFGGGNKVVKSFVADINNDGIAEYGFVVWKKGNYGTEMPFWEKKNDNSYSSHLFLYHRQNNKYLPYWQSSKLENPICKINIKDVNKDQKLELVVMEGKYNWLGYSCRDEKETWWKWNGWGFTKI